MQMLADRPTMDKSNKSMDVNLNLKKPRRRRRRGVYTALQPIVVMSSALGVMPLTRVTSWSQSNHDHDHGHDHDHDDVQDHRQRQLPVFEWRSPQTMANVGLLVVLVGSLAMAIDYYATTSVTTWNIKDMTTRPRDTIFYSSCVTFTAFSLAICRRLPDVMRRWDDAAQALRKYQTIVQRASVPCRLHLRRSTAIGWSLAFVLSAAIEHALHDVTVAHEQCSGGGGGGGGYNATSAGHSSPMSFFECYHRGNPFVAKHLPYNVVTSIAVFIFNKLATVSWNFPDLLLMLLSLALRSNFRVISCYLEVTSAAKKSGDEWMQVRNDHYSLVTVAQHLEQLLSPTVVLSYAVNIYFLCIQIFFAIRPAVRTPLEAVYLYSSFGHLLFRLCAVSFAAASFHDEAAKPFHYLHRCPSKSYCEEVHRFMCQISQTPAAFTGCRMFTIDRQLFFSILSVILTYELILLNV